jgi:hypothetical protein
MCIWYILPKRTVHTISYNGSYELKTLAYEAENYPSTRKVLDVN